MDMITNTYTYIDVCTCIFISAIGNYQWIFVRQIFSSN